MLLLLLKRGMIRLCCSHSHVKSFFRAPTLYHRQCEVASSALQGAFHGRTMGAMALTSSKTFYKTGFAPLMPGAFIAPFPYCLHCKVRQTASDGKDWYKVSSPSSSSPASSTLSLQYIVAIPWQVDVTRLRRLLLLSLCLVCKSLFTCLSTMLNLVPRVQTRSLILHEHSGITPWLK